jgi:hypothetical protein
MFDCGHVGFPDWLYSHPAADGQKSTPSLWYAPTSGSDGDNAEADVVAPTFGLESEARDRLAEPTTIDPTTTPAPLKHVTMQMVHALWVGRGAPDWSILALPLWSRNPQSEVTGLPARLGQSLWRWCRSGSAFPPPRSGHRTGHDGPVVAAGPSGNVYGPSAPCLDSSPRGC